MSPRYFAGEAILRATSCRTYTYIPTITLLDKLRSEGFQPFFGCQTRVRDQGKREHTKHMLRLRREGQIVGKEVPEIILLNSHDGSSSYQMIPCMFMVRKLNRPFLSFLTINSNKGFSHIVRVIVG